MTLRTQPIKNNVRSKPEHKKKHFEIGASKVEKEVDEECEAVLCTFRFKWLEFGDFVSTIDEASGRAENTTDVQTIK